MATTIVTLTQGSYSYENGTIKSNGSLNINQDKLIMNIRWMSTGLSSPRP